MYKRFFFLLGLLLAGVLVTSADTIVIHSNTTTQNSSTDEQQTSGVVGSFNSTQQNNDIVIQNNVVTSNQQNSVNVQNVEVTPGKEQQKTVKIKLTHKNNGQPVTDDALQEMHTKKLHVLIINNRLTDYSHVHPTPLIDQPGYYVFNWEPQSNDYYRLWVDIVPVETKQQEYVVADLTPPQLQPTIDKTLVQKNTVNGLTFAITFDNPLHINKASMGTLTVTDKNGQPVTQLEPIMGAYAHIVGFYEDFHSIMHIHPMGKEPSKPSDRGGSVLQFHIEPKHAGFVKLFVQVVYQGKEIYVPFGVEVKE